MLSGMKVQISTIEQENQNYIWRHFCVGSNSPISLLSLWISSCVIRFSVVDCRFQHEFSKRVCWFLCHNIIVMWRHWKVSSLSFWNRVFDRFFQPWWNLTQNEMKKGRLKGRMSTKYGRWDSILTMASK